MASRFIRVKNTPTVYVTDGGAARAVSNEDELRRLGGDMGLVQDVDSLDGFNSTPDANDPSLTLAGLTDAERAGYLTNASKRYDPTKQAFADLVGGKLSATDLDYEDTASRLKTGTENSIKGVQQDLSNRGFLRSGEQVGKTVAFNEDLQRNVQRADINRQISRANILLEQLGFNADLDKQAMSDANTQAQQELQVRQSNTGFARDNYGYKMTAAQQEQARLDNAFGRASDLGIAEISSKDAAEQRALQRQILEQELKKAQMALEESRNSKAGAQGMDVAALLKQIQGQQPAQQQAGPNTPNTPQDISSKLTEIFKKGVLSNDNAVIAGLIADNPQIPRQQIIDLYYQTRKPYETAPAAAGGGGGRSW